MSKNQQLTSPTAWLRRQRVWRHNSFIGHCVMMRQQLNAILASDSTSTETKHYASTILGLVPKLQNSLSVRIDPEPEEPKET